MRALRRTQYSIKEPRRSSLGCHGVQQEPGPVYRGKQVERAQRVFGEIPEVAGRRVANLVNRQRAVGPMVASRQMPRTTRRNTKPRPGVRPGFLYHDGSWVESVAPLVIGSTNSLGARTRVRSVPSDRRFESGGPS